MIGEASRFDRLGADLPDLGDVGEFSLPPLNTVQRAFQALHIDFGLPIATESAVDVARFTALYVDAERTDASAAARIVPLHPILSQRGWPEHDVVRDRERHGVGPGTSVEGMLGRLVELVCQGATLPAVDAQGFLCGMEFASLNEEYGFFAQHGLDLAPVEQDIAVGPGELLIFNTLTTAHGRRGTREPGELHQLCIGYPMLDVERQELLLRRVLAAFSAPTA